MLHLIEGNERFLAILFISNLDRETKSATFHGGTGPPTSSDACRIVHDETMDNPYCNPCGCGMPFSGRLVWSTQQFGARSSFQHDCDAVFTFQPTHHSQLFVSWTRMPSPWELHTSALASFVLVAVRCTASIAHVDFL